MKRTTYMLGGFYALVFVLSAASFFLFTQKRPDSHRHLPIGGEPTVVALSPARVILFQVREPEENKSDRRTLFRYEDCPLTLSTAADASEAGTLLCPESLAHNLKQTLTGDTLRIEFDLSGWIGDRKLASGWAFPSLQAADSTVRELRLTLPQGTQTVISRLWEQPLHLQGVQMDSLSVIAWAGDVRVSGSRLRALHPQGRRLELCSGAVENLHLDLDELNTWKIHPDSFSIGTEYLTGSRHHTNRLLQGECRRIVWLPKKEEARLSVELTEHAELLLP